MKKNKIIGYSIGIVGVVGLVGTALLTAQAYRPAQATQTDESFPEQTAVTAENRYPSGHIGMDGQYWEYVEVHAETEYDGRQDLLDEGLVTLWQEFSEDHLMWFAAHYPGTFTYIGDNAYIGATITVTSPAEYEGRHRYDDPDILTFEIVERIDTDIWAEEVIETIDERATDVYNDGHDTSSIIIQHSGEQEDDVVLYYGIRQDD